MATRRVPKAAPAGVRPAAKPGPAMPPALARGNLGNFGATYRRAGLEDGPPEAPPTPDDAIVTLGMPLRYNRASSLFMDDPLFQELRGQRAVRTMQRLLADPIISGAIERTALWLSGADWQVRPGGSAPLDVEFADFVNENLENLTSGWRGTVAAMADAMGWGFSLHEVLFELDGDALRWAEFSPREQQSVRSWYVDVQTGRLKSVVQITDRGISVPIPAWKVLHFRTHPGCGRPEGRSLVRNAFLPWSDKQELRRIVKIGLRRDFTGVAKMEVPAKILSKAATPLEQAALSQAEALVRDFERDEREGLVVPSATNPDGTSTGWGFSLVQSAGRRQIDFDQLKTGLDRDILIALLSEYIMLGHENVGSKAMVTVKSTLLGRAITTWLDHTATMMVRKAVPVLQAFNPRFAGAAVPIWEHGDIDEIPLAELGAFLQAAATGMFLTPGPELEEALRKRADLPQVTAEQQL